MSLKDILVIADDAKSAPVRLDVAAALAAAQKAHVVALHVRERPYTPAGNGVSPPTLIDWQESIMRQHAEAAKKVVEAAERRNGCSFEWRTVDGDAVATSLLHSRYADLIV